jgi:hypothetical protein
MAERLCRMIPASSDAGQFAAATIKKPFPSMLIFADWKWLLI